ncbi:nucleolar and coiled-body phosphoprotein 1 [Fundulus heteroclitus]|uniref:nucleolar and coiled-body phosphoprotein 1 n=1 Tax=Fundulus heteroclitus TaxID=8078 RepID=UPI00165B3529|nr:nucleolar and coiled-body phosphoprotein 1 [Fundulus heteroclitus]XP_021178924.2 nucleolar and coiled-body phosphoprotein 1 [Fundulus heteroclitus]
MEEGNPLEREHSLRVVLPAGIEKSITVHGSKPVMDLLVTLCANYHLNPSDHTIEFLSPHKNNVSYKPNSPIGLLEAEKILLMPKGTEDKTKKPYMPEATVRLLINYSRSRKTVVRVNPRLPLHMLLPAVCDKCDFDVETTVLLRDAQAKEPLDLTKTLNDHGLREVFAADAAARDPADCQDRTAEGAAGSPTEVASPPPPQDLQRKQKKRGFFSFFRRRKKKNEMNGTASAPTSPGPAQQTRVRGASESISSTNTLPADMSKKRLAPPPPVAVSQSVPNNLSTCCAQGAQSSGESTSRSTKRRAPPPPCAAAKEEQRLGTDVGESLKTLEELREAEDPQPLSSWSSSPSPTPHHEVPASFRPSFRGKDLSDARSALAKVLTSSVSKGTLVRRLRNSAGFPSFQVSSCMSLTSTCPDDGDVCAERESAFRSNLPTEGGWEDPVQRSGWTSFKVVPPKKAGSPDPEMTAQDQKSADAECEAPATGGKENRTEACVNQASGPPSPDTDSALLEDKATSEEQKEDLEVAPGDPPALLGAGDGETADGAHVDSDIRSDACPSDDPLPCSSCTDEEAEEDVSHEDEEETTFPPPPPPVVFSEDAAAAEKEVSRASPPSSQRAAPSLNGHTKAGDESSSAAAEQPLDKTPAAPSRFAQAVAMAVQRSRLQTLGFGPSFGPQASGGPNGTLQSPPRSSYQYGA